MVCVSMRVRVSVCVSVCVSGYVRVEEGGSLVCSGTSCEPRAPTFSVMSVVVVVVVVEDSRSGTVMSSAR